MDINIHSKKETYEVGDLLEIRGYGFRMIVRIDRHYALMDMDGMTTTCSYNSIKELSNDRIILNHYKNKDLQLSLKEKENK